RADVAADAERVVEQRLAAGDYRLVGTRDVGVEGKAEGRGGADLELGELLGRSGDVHGLGVEQRHLDQVIAGLGGAGDRLAALVLVPTANPHQRVNADLVPAETLF